MGHRKYLRVSKQSETLLINQLSIAREQQQQQVFKFGFGQSPFPVPVNVTQSLADNAHRKEYMNVQGYVPLRQAVCDFHNRFEGRCWQADEVIVGTGSKILLYCLMAAFRQAEVILPAPSWVSYEPQGHLAGHKVHWLETDYVNKWKISAEQLDDFCLARSNPDIPLIMVLNYPSNPTGQSYSAIELKALAEVLKRHNVIVIADEIYAFLSFEKQRSSLEQFYPEGTITTSGLSKWCGAGGWRIGYARIPNALDGLMETTVGVASETYSCAPSPMQIAATEAYDNLEQAQQFQQQQISILSEIATYSANRLQEAGIQVVHAEGGFYLFPDFSPFAEKLKLRGITSSEALTARIMEETGVALLPGSAFGMPESSLTARLAFVDFDGREALFEPENEAVYQHLRQGIERLAQWASKL